jgi:hypothetical protein
MSAGAANPGNDRAGRHWRPTLSGPLERSELEVVLQQATQVLLRVGIACQHAESVRRLTSEPGIAYEDGRLRFSPRRVMDLVERVRCSARPAPDDGKLTLGGCWAGLYYCDPETLRVRKATTDEARQMARLWDARGYAGVVPLMPGDVPPALVTLASERIALLESRRLGGSLAVLDPEEVRCLIEMNLAAGRPPLRRRRPAQRG